MRAATLRRALPNLSSTSVNTDFAAARSTTSASISQPVPAVLSRAARVLRGAAGTFRCGPLIRPPFNAAAWA